MSENRNHSDANVTLKLTISDLSFVALAKDGKEGSILLPDARSPKDGPDGQPLPLHRPVFFVEGSEGTRLPWVLDDEDIVLTLDEPTKPFSVKDPAAFDELVPPIAQAMVFENGPGGSGKLSPTVLNAVPAKGSHICARLREHDATWGNQALEAGTLSAEEPLGGRDPWFVDVSPKKCHEVKFKSEAFAQSLRYEVSARTITIRGVKFGRTGNDYRKITLTENGTYHGYFVNLGATYPPPVRDLDPDYGWFYDLLDDKPHLGLQRVPEFRNRPAAASGGADCTLASSRY